MFRLVMIVGVLVPNLLFGAPKNYQILPDTAQVHFYYKLFGQKWTGRFPLKSADIVLDVKKASMSSVKVRLDTRGARAGFFAATQVMRSEKMLNAENFPDAVFVSERFERDGKSVQITGRLTLRGVTKPQVMQGRFFQTQTPGALRVELRGEVSRSAFGAGAYANLVGDVLEVFVSAEVMPAR